jgi:hypothetical protein
VDDGGRQVADNQSLLGLGSDILFENVLSHVWTPWWVRV